MIESFPPFRPHPFLRSAHAQTLAGVYLPMPKLPYRAVQHVVELDDGDRLVLHGAVDPLVPPEGGRDTAALIAVAELIEVPGMGHDMPPALYPTFVRAIMRAVKRAHAPAQ